MKKYLSILFAVGLAVSLLVLMASPALASHTVYGGDPVIELNGDPSGGQTFYVGDTITITGDVQPYAEMSGAGYNEAYTNAELWVTGPSGSGYVKAEKGDWGPYSAVVNIPYSPTITYPLTAAGTHTVKMWSYACACDTSESPEVCFHDWGDDLLTFDVVQVEIDIKPGSFPNSINLKSKGVVPVAVLTTDDFDATTVDPEKTVLFADAPPVRWTMEDVDGDGDLDMLFHFKTQELELDEDSTEATLYSYDPLNRLIVGTDSVKIVPKGK